MTERNIVCFYIPNEKGS